MCNITEGIEKSCTFEIGGLREEVYIAGNAGALTLTLGTNSIVTGISGSNFYKFEPAEDTLVAEANMVKGGSGARFHLHQVSFTINTDSNDVKNIIEDLELSRVVAVVRKKDGTYQLFGAVGTKTYGMRCEVSNKTSGAAAADAFGYTITLNEHLLGRQLFLEAGLDPSGTGDGPYTWS